MDELGALLLVSNAGGNATLDDADAVSLRDRGLAYVGLSDGNESRLVRGLTPAGKRRLVSLRRDALDLAIRVLEADAIVSAATPRVIMGATWQRYGRWYAARDHELVTLARRLEARGAAEPVHVIDTWIAEREAFATEGRAAWSVGLDV